jgi:hypothetical protein
MDEINYMDNPSEKSTTLSPLKQAYLVIEKLLARLDTAEKAKREPIAVIGMGCRFPGGANDPDGLWDLLAHGVNAVREVPPERWDIDQYYDPDVKKPGKMITRWGGLSRTSTSLTRSTSTSHRVKRAAWTRSSACCWR